MLKLSAHTPTQPVNALDYTLDPQGLQAALQAELQARFRHFPDTLVAFPDLSEVIRFDPDTGLPRLQTTNPDMLYLPQIEQVMLLFNDWTADILTTARDYQDAATLAGARSESAHYGACMQLAGLPGNQRIKELQAKQDPRVRDAEFQEALYRSLSRRMEDAADRLSKAIDVMKYLHRRILRMEGSGNGVVS